MASSVKSAERTLDVLRLLSSSLRPVPTMAIARACAIPKSSTHHLLNVMRARGWVTYYEADRGWGLGAAAFEAGSAYLRSQPVRHLGHPILRALTAGTGQSSHLAALQGPDVLHLDKHDAPDPPAEAPAVGVRLPAHVTALGQAMLAWLSAAQLRALYVSPTLASRGARGPRTVAELLEELEAVRVRGYASEVGLTARGVGCVAAAALSHEGHPTAAVGVTFAADRHDEASRRALAAETRAAARRLSDAMGVRPARQTESA